MHVRPGGPAGGPGLGNCRAAPHQVAGFDQQLGRVSVTGDQVVAVVDVGLAGW